MRFGRKIRQMVWIDKIVSEKILLQRGMFLIKGSFRQLENIYFSCLRIHEKLSRSVSSETQCSLIGVTSDSLGQVKRL